MVREAPWGRIWGLKAPGLPSSLEPASWANNRMTASSIGISRTGPPKKTLLWLALGSRSIGLTGQDKETLLVAQQLG